MKNKPVKAQSFEGYSWEQPALPRYWKERTPMFRDENESRYMCSSEVMGKSKCVRSYLPTDLHDHFTDDLSSLQIYFALAMPVYIFVSSFSDRLCSRSY